MTATPIADTTPEAQTGSAADADVLRAVSQRVRWLSAAIVDAANRGRPNTSGVRVGGHQASSASMVDIMVALWFHSLRDEDRVSRHAGRWTLPMRPTRARRTARPCP